MTERQRLLQIATWAAVGVATALAILKLGAYLATGSIAMLSSLVDSLLDIGASTVNLLAVRQAQVPADDEHRFGHGKAEPLAGLAQAAFISGSALFLGIEAVQHLIDPRPIENTTVGLVVTVIALVATLALVLLQRHVAKKTGSVAIEADRLHYMTDILSNGVVIAALVGAGLFGITWLDPVLGLAMALVILKSAWSVGRQSIDMLMDRELPDAERAEIERRACAVAGVIGIHDLRTRRAGPDVFIDLHLELDDQMPLIDAHLISDAVEQAVMACTPNASVFIHQDPRSIVALERAR